MGSASGSEMTYRLANAPISDDVLNEIGELIRQIAGNVPGLSPSVPLILALVESNIHLYRNYMEYSKLRSISLGHT